MFQDSDWQGTQVPRWGCCCWKELKEVLRSLPVLWQSSPVTAGTLRGGGATVPSSPLPDTPSYRVASVKSQTSRKSAGAAGGTKISLVLKTQATLKEQLHRADGRRPSHFGDLREERKLARRAGGAGPGREGRGLGGTRGGTRAGRRGDPAAQGRGRGKLPGN